MSTAMFQTLPEEITEHILHFIDDRPTLHSLCLVSSNLNRIATPHLYSNLALRKDDFQHLRPLSVLLWTSPKHRACVRSITVRRAYGGNLVPWPKYDGEGGLEVLIRRQIGLYVRDGDKEDWYRQVRDGIDALPIASLLLRSLPHVGEMQFDGFMLVDPAVKMGKRAWVC